MCVCVCVCVCMSVCLCVCLCVSILMPRDVRCRHSGTCAAGAPAAHVRALAWADGNAIAVVSAVGNARNAGQGLEFQE